MIEIILAQPRGFCAGVERAIAIVETALEKFGSPLYVYHEIVHNKFVVAELEKKGVIFIDNLQNVPKKSVIIFSAHGVAKSIEQEANFRNLYIVDATCPLVTKVHNEAKKAEEKGHHLILIGHLGHPEVVGTAGRVDCYVHVVENLSDIDNIIIAQSEKISYVTQTTLSVDDTLVIINKLKEKFPNIQGPSTKDICYATQNRQNAVRSLANMVDVLLVIGAKNSSNANRLKDLGMEMGVASYLIDSVFDLDISWLEGKKKIGITAGASAPEQLTKSLVDYLATMFEAKVQIMDGISENIKFKLPKILEKIG